VALFLNVYFAVHVHTDGRRDMEGLESDYRRNDVEGLASDYVCAFV